MDDSEKTYGYSEDIYHGRHGQDAEKSYEYSGAEGNGDAQGSELSPEEAAIHIEGPEGNEEPVADPEAPDYGRAGEHAAVESFTWNLSTDETEKDAQIPEMGERANPKKS